MSRKKLKKSRPSPPVSSAPKSPAAAASLSRNIAEWTFNFVILVFATGMIAQPFVIPTSSMEDNLLVGDHLIVDRLVYAPPGPCRVICCHMSP